MTTTRIDPEQVTKKGGAALMQALLFLEEEAAKLGYAEVSHLVGCAAVALRDQIGPHVGNA